MIALNCGTPISRDVVVRSQAAQDYHKAIHITLDFTIGLWSTDGDKLTDLLTFTRGNLSRLRFVQDG